MLVRNAEFEDMKRLGHIMSVSFRTAFSEFVTPQTMEACAQEDNCIALLEGIYREGKMHFLIGQDSGMLVWQDLQDSAEIVAIHSLPESRGTGLGHAMLVYAMEQIGEKPTFLWAFKQNQRARRFYEKHGFQWDGSERVSKFDGALEVRYVKKAPVMDETLNYYNQNADAFITGTQNADMSQQYRHFLKHLPGGGKLLDLGCGGGRDSVYFSSLGFEVTAIDGSEELCRRVRECCGIPALCIKFEELSFAEEFDGVWACASLLHVKKADIPGVMGKVSAALKPGGVLYASFKYGSEERICSGRFFNDYTEKDLDTLLTPENQLSLLEYWITEDVRPERAGEKWLNFIARRRNHQRWFF